MWIIHLRKRFRFSTRLPAFPRSIDKCLKTAFDAQESCIENPFNICDKEGDPNAAFENHEASPHSLMGRLSS